MAWKRIALSLCATVSLGACNEIDRATSAPVCASDESRQMVESLVPKLEGGGYHSTLERMIADGDLVLTDVSYSGRDRANGKITCSANLRIQSDANYVRPENVAIEFWRQKTADGSDYVYTVSVPNGSLIGPISTRSLSAHFRKLAIEDAKRPPQRDTFTMPKIGEDDPAAEAQLIEAAPVIAPEPQPPVTENDAR